ncbi:O-methyltransferase [soil metagenome]
MDIVDPSVDGYLKDLAAGDDEPVLLAMEALAEEKGFPIIGRLCGRVLELLTRAVAARRSVEMGSGFGYSAYGFSRAAGPGAEIHLTDMEADNERQALDFLGRAGLDGHVSFHVANAFDALDAIEGGFDIAYCDIDKDGYPQAWSKGRERVRVGGFYICDNMLWSGRVAGAAEDDTPELTRAIDATNRAVARDPDWRSIIIPLRDGVLVAQRLR